MRRLVQRLALPAAFAARRAACEASEESQQPSEEEPAKPLADVKPFVAMFLDAASRETLTEAFPESGEARSASYVLLEPTEVTTDITRPAVFAPLMGEPATAEFVGRRTVDGVTTLRAVVRLGDTALEGLDTLPALSWGGAGDDDVAHRGATATAPDYEPLSTTTTTTTIQTTTTTGEKTPQKKKQLTVSGHICRAEYWYDGRCHLEPLLECPLCAFMKQSPCKDVFQKWEDCLNASEAAGGSDDERQNRFVTNCAAQTIALKECVDKYPEFFGTMFGSGDDAPEDSPVVEGDLDRGKDQPGPGSGPGPGGDDSATPTTRTDKVDREGSSSSSSSPLEETKE